MVFIDRTSEILEVDTFLSISHVKWEFRSFNIITGDMGAGKSLCIKLLKFFEDIIPELLTSPYDDFIEKLDVNRFYEFLSRKFANIFVLPVFDNNKYPPFRIRYAFSFKEEVCDIIITGGDETNIVVKSSFLEELLTTWKEFLEKKIIASHKKVTPDGFEEVKRSLYAELLNKFGSYFPLATTFIPASRAALAFGSNYTDDYLKEYRTLLDVLPRFKNRNQEIINTILKAKMKINGALWLESDDGRQTPIAKASSGQQEIIYVLMLLEKLGNFQYTYGTTQSVFIEEPSAHLFPLEQKQTIEHIVWMYNCLKDEKKSVRFFITTHSPYILNSLNNILKKGALIEKHKEQTDRINNMVDIPHLHADDISAYFINGDGTGESMLDENEKYLYAHKIAGISRDIDEVTQKLSELNNELLDEEG
jgi:AAA15 family ATPase/GTPase